MRPQDDAGVDVVIARVLERVDELLVELDPRESALALDFLTVRHGIYLDGTTVFDNTP